MCNFSLREMSFKSLQSFVCWSHYVYSPLQKKQYCGFFCNNSSARNLGKNQLDLGKDTGGPEPLSLVKWLF